MEAPRTTTRERARPVAPAAALTREVIVGAREFPGAAGTEPPFVMHTHEEEMMENPEPTEVEEELAQTERQEEEEDMRGTTDPEEQEG